MKKIILRWLLAGALLASVLTGCYNTYYDHQSDSYQRDYGFPTDWGVANPSKTD